MAQLSLRGIPIGSVKGVLFDKDGTLSDSETRLENLAKRRIQQAIQVFQKGNSHKKETSHLRKMLSTCYGLTNKGIDPGGTIAVASRKDNLISTATVFCLLGDSWPNALQIANEIFNSADESERSFKSFPHKKTLLPGAMTLLSSLKEARVRCGVISNDCSSSIQDFLNSNDLKDTLTSFWSAEDVPTKPDPFAVKGLCNQLDLDPTECALIGDADSDLRMAKEAKIFLRLGFTGGWNCTPHLTAHQHLISQWEELGVNCGLDKP